MTTITRESQRIFWNEWNAAHREHGGNEVSNRQAEIVRGWLNKLDRHDLKIVEVGCGAGWLTPFLLPFGDVVATDLADELIDRAKVRFAKARFLAGDFMALDFGTNSFDVAVCLEVLSHVADQRAFVGKLAALINPGGYLMLATQNKPVLKRFNRVPPPAPGQLRHWVDQHELRALLQPHFDVPELFAVTPRANRGIIRLVASYKVKAILRALVGNRYERFLERRGFGWTLMALARKREEVPSRTLAAGARPIV